MPAIRPIRCPTLKGHSRLLEKSEAAKLNQVIINIIKNLFYITPHRPLDNICCLSSLKKENLTFLMDRDKGLTVGKKLYFELVDRGYKTVELSDSAMKQYLWHLAHATQAINADEYNLRDRTVRKTRRSLEKIMNSEQTRQIIVDASLDR